MTNATNRQPATEEHALKNEHGVFLRTEDDMLADCSKSRNDEQPKVSTFMLGIRNAVS
jgi:hypothetical protein